MTLFHLRELWSTNCGNNEEFDKTSLCICNVDNCASGHDKIVTASFNGVLRVFNIELNESDKSGHNQYQASDLLLEVDFKEPILQIASGVLLANTSNTQLAVLHPTKFCVYSISSTSGATEHGTSYNVLLIYEHVFDYKAVNILLGSFGQIKGKEIVCIQNCNSSLNFYENESFSFGFSRNSEGSRKFPMELAYIPHRDLIIMADDLYNVECYRYQELAMANLAFKGDDSRASDENRQVTAEWVYSLGETVLHIETVCLDKWFVVLLGERNLCVLRENGSLWFVKKFETNPSCLCSYANETKDSLITIVGTHMFNVLIYQNDCLKWATKIPFVPVAIQRGNFADISGALVMLSDEGNVIVGYLGTNPSLKIIPMPSVNDTPNSDKIAEELKELKKVVNTYNLEGSKGTEAENKLSVYLDMTILSLESTRDHTGHDFSPQMIVHLELSTMVPLKDVKVSFFPNDFHEISPKQVTLESLEKSHSMRVLLKAKFPLALSGKIKCCIVFHKDSAIRMVRKCVRLPFEQLVQREPQIKGHKYSVKLLLDKPLEEKASLGVLFEDLVASGGSPSELSVHFKSNPLMEATIRVASEETGAAFQVEGNHIASLYRTLRELRRRLQVKSIKVVSMLTNVQPIDALCATIEGRLKLRKALSAYQGELDKFSQHYRVLQKRILVKLKDKNPTSLANFEKLLKTIHSKINDNVDRIVLGQKALQTQNYLIWCHLKALKLMLKMSAPSQEKNKMEQFLKLISIQQMSDFSKNWEEQLESSLLEILQLDRDISNLAKVIDYEQNSMRDCQTLRATLRSAYQMFCDQTGASLQIV